jgi:hypothetical protein
VSEAAAGGEVPGAPGSEVRGAPGGEVPMAPGSEVRGAPGREVSLPPGPPESRPATPDSATVGKSAANHLEPLAARGRWDAGHLLAWLFGPLCLIHLVPIWSVTYLPTMDGPSHLYNAWVLQQLGDGEHHARLAATYEVARRPVPNWLCYVVLRALLLVAPPLVAEKLLVSGILLLWLVGCWYLAGSVERERQWVAFIGFPLAYNLIFQFGFWNFCLSVGFFMLAVGHWWRHRRAPDLRTGLAQNALLLLCYFSHILSLELALFAIGVLWLCSFERGAWRRHLRHLALLAPQAVLPLWFMLGHGGGVQADTTPVRELLRRFLHFDVLVTFRGPGQVNEWVALAFALLVALTLIDRLKSVAGPVAAPAEVNRVPAGMDRDRAPAEPGPAQGHRGVDPMRPGPAWRLRRWVRREDGFAWLALLLTLIYLAAPEGMAGGGILKPRLALYPWLALLPWLSVRLTAPARLAAALLLAAPGLLNAWNAWQCYRQMDPVFHAFVHTLDPAAPGSGVLPLYFEHPACCVRTGALGHAIDYAAVERGLIDWGNYEAATDLFPLRFKPAVAALRPDTYTLEAAPNDLRIRQVLPFADYILSVGMPDDAPVRRRIRRYYDQVGERGPVRLFARRPGAPPPVPSKSSQALSISRGQATR